MHDRPLSPAEQYSEVIVDSTVLMHYDSGLEAARSWWEESVSGGVRIFVSEISLKGSRICLARERNGSGNSRRES